MAPVANARDTMPRVLWLIPVLMTLHNVEKGVMMLRQVGTAQVGVAHMAVAVGLVALVSVALTAWCLRGGPDSIGAYALMAMQGLVFFNALALGWLAIKDAAYQPGLASAILVNIPFSSYCLRRALQARYVRPRPVAVVLATAGLLYLALSWWIPSLVDFVGECVGCA